MSAVALGIAAPLALKMSRLAVAAPAAAPTRLFIFYLPHGIANEHFDPVVNGADINLSANGVGMLGAFEPYKKSLNVVRGISMANGANNHAAIRAMLTGFPEGTAAGKAVDSIDNIIANTLNVTPFVVGARPYTPGAGFTSDSYLVQHGSWVRPTEDPAAAADSYFQNLGAGTAQPAQVDESAFRGEALDLTSKELQTMSSSLSALTGETNKLKLHLDALQSLKSSATSNGGGAVSCSTRPALPAVDAVRGKDPLDAQNFGLVLDAHLEAAAHAFLCGTARVITMQNMHVNSDLNMAFPGGPNFPQGHHDPISHAPPDSDALRANFATVQKWFYQRVADKMLATLNQPDPLDTSGSMRTVLDNSVIYICSEISDGNNHNSDCSSVWIDGKEHGTYLPTVLLGGGGGYLKTGQVVDVKHMHTDVLATIAAAVGAPVTTIGGQPASAIPELKA